MTRVAIESGAPITAEEGLLLLGEIERLQHIARAASSLRLHTQQMVNAHETLDLALAVEPVERTPRPVSPGEEPF